jgi:hypothetical protein
MKKLVAEYPGAGAPPADSDGAFNVELSLMAMKAIQPDMSVVNVSKALNFAFNMEHPEADKQLNVPADLISDLCRPADAKDVKAYAQEVKAAKVKRATFLSKRSAHVSKYFASDAVQAKKPSKAPRWLPPHNPQATQVDVWIRENMPPDDVVVLALDQYNGRWRVINSDFQWRSISYTQRGFQSAAALVLHQAWTYFFEITGVSAPFPLPDLVPQFNFDE